MRIGKMNCGRKNSSRFLTRASALFVIGAMAVSLSACSGCSNVSCNSVTTSTIETEIVTDEKGETEIETKVVWTQNGTTSYVEPTTPKSEKTTEAVTEKSGEGSTEKTSVKETTSATKPSQSATTQATTQATTAQPTTQATTAAPTTAPTTQATTAAPTEAPTAAPTTAPTTEATTPAPTFAEGHYYTLDKAAKTLTIGPAYEEYVTMYGPLATEHPEYIDEVFYPSGMWGADGMINHNQEYYITTVYFLGSKAYGGGCPLIGTGPDWTQHVDIYAPNLSYHDVWAVDYKTAQYDRIENSRYAFDDLVDDAGAAQNRYPGGFTIHLSDMTISYEPGGYWYVNGELISSTANGGPIRENAEKYFPNWFN